MAFSEGFLLVPASQSYGSVVTCTEKTYKNDTNRFVLAKTVDLESLKVLQKGKALTTCFCLLVLETGSCSWTLTSALWNTVLNVTVVETVCVVYIHILRLNAFQLRVT